MTRENKLIISNNKFNNKAHFLMEDDKFHKTNKINNQYEQSRFSVNIILHSYTILW